MSASVRGAVDCALGSHLDEDTLEYITSLLGENPRDDDAREAVEALILGGVEDEQFDPNDICKALFDLLDLGGDHGTTEDTQEDIEVDAPLRKLGQAVTMKEHDIQSYAMGLSAELDPVSLGDEKESQIAAFYANMIDGKLNEDAVSERDRRKARQKELRIKMEEEERQRAIQEAMAMLEEPEVGKTVESMMESSSDNMQDVHFRNLDLPNLRGGGPNLLQNASITLARGRRYGLMGRNGCGKTTFLSFMASRQIPEAVPKNMNMLLVRQEIIGNEWSAVETVLKSDVKRQSVKRFIEWCEAELDNMDNPVKREEPEEQDKNVQAESKGRQKLRDRRRQNVQKAAVALVSTTNASSTDTEEKRADLTDKISKAYQRLASIEEEEGGDPEPRARKVLSGLGFSEIMMDKPTSELSGGWRMRVSLSCALFANPSLLLLDEPTNHLGKFVLLTKPVYSSSSEILTLRLFKDLEAVLWLEKYLTTKFTGTLVVVSHDRHFLNEVVTDVVHFHKSNLTCYRGDISNFEAVRDDNRLRQIRLREVQEAKKAHLQKYIDLHAQSGENGVKASRQRKSKMKKLEKVGVMAQEGKRYKASYDGEAEEVDEYEEDEKVDLQFPDPGSFDGDIIRLEQMGFGYSPEINLLHDVDLTINFKSRVALLGRNGCGYVRRIFFPYCFLFVVNNFSRKSTLIKLAVGSLQPTKGKVQIDARAKIEYLAQHQLEQLDPDGTPLQTMVDRYPGDRSNTHIGQLRRYLANFGLGGEILPLQKIHTMSGGQKCRLCLACAMYRKPHLLILDEPTNHVSATYRSDCQVVS